MKAEKKKEARKKEVVRGVGKLLKEAKNIEREMMKARKDAKCRLYCLHPSSKALCKRRKYQKSMELLIRKCAYQKLVWKLAQKIMPNLRFQTSALRA